MALFASISLVLFSLLYLGAPLIPATFRRAGRLAAATLAATALLATVAVAIRWPELDRAVIIGAQPAAHIAPAGDSATLFALRTGELVRAESRYGDFIRVQTLDGRAGWVAAGQVEKIIPSAS